MREGKQWMKTTCANRNFWNLRSVSSDDILAPPTEMRASHAATRDYCDGVPAIIWPLSGRAQPVKKVPRLCFLMFDPGTPQSPAKRFEAFFEVARPRLCARTDHHDRLFAPKGSKRSVPRACGCVSPARA
jgi:hypothetical protein